MKIRIFEFKSYLMPEWGIKMDPQSLNFLADRKRFRLQPLISTSFARSFCSKTSTDNPAVPYKSMTLNEPVNQGTLSSKTNFDDPAEPYKSITLNQQVDQSGFITGAKLLDFVSVLQRADSNNHIKECARKFTMHSESYKKLMSPYEQLTTMSLASTHLVGGFVGSKSQVGGTSRGGFGVQIWDIILDKFVELMGTAVHSSDSYYEVFFDELNGKVPSDQHSKYAPKQTQHVANCKPSGKNCSPSLDTVHSKQSYADVTKIAAHHTPVVDVSISNTRLCSPVIQAVNVSVQQKNTNRSDSWQENINKKERRRPPNHMHPRNSAHSHQKHSKGLYKMNWKDKQEARNLGLEYSVHENRQYHPNRNNKYSHGKKVIDQNRKNSSETYKPKCKMNSYIEIVDQKTSARGDPKKRTSDISHMKNNEEKCVSSIVNLLKPENFSPDLEITDKNCPVIKVGLNFSLSPTENKFEKDRLNKTENMNERCRYLSECSVDSDDSFVVFDAGGGNDTECTDFSVNDEDCNESDSGDEDDDDSVWTDESCSLEDDDVDEWILTEDSCELLTKKIDDVNARWRELSDDLKPKFADKPEKKVRFAEGESLTRVHPMIAWDYALRAARVGPWETIARDSVRFKNRISRTASVLDPVLQSSHRENIYKERFTSDMNESVN